MTILVGVVLGGASVQRVLWKAGKDEITLRILIVDWGERERERERRGRGREMEKNNIMDCYWTLTNLIIMTCKNK